MLQASEENDDVKQKAEIEEDIAVFNGYEKDETWWKELKEVVVKKFAPKPAANA